jgi:hypothetical protein
MSVSERTFLGPILQTHRIERKVSLRAAIQTARKRQNRIAGIRQERPFSSPISDTWQLAESVTSETAKMKTLEEARAEKLRLRDRFPSGGDVCSLLDMADQQKDRTVPRA